MKAEIRDGAVLGALTPSDLAAYLSAAGWHQQAGFTGKTSLWLKTETDGKEYDVTLPLRREFADYSLRVGELLHTLSSVEDRSELEIFRDVMTATCDIVRLRATGPAADNGTMPLDQAVSFIERSRELMLAAACAAIEKRALYSKRKPKQAADYLGRARLGQTEQGSYVFTIISPLPQELDATQRSLFPEDTTIPYERKVTQTLVSALGALEGAARKAMKHGNLVPFSEAVESGVSANLCDAVAGLVEASAGEPIDIGVSWSRNRPLKTAAPGVVHLSPEFIPIINEAAGHFRATAPLDDFELEGFVTRLDRSTSATEGEVTVEGVVENHIRKIAVWLDAEAYKTAAHAHIERAKVTCLGDLVREGRGHRLLNPRGFQVNEDEPSA